jgi:hypothetical protein
VPIGVNSVAVHAHDYLDNSPRFAFANPDIEEHVYMLGPFPSAPELPKR